MTHLVGLLFVVLCVAGVAAALCWTFIPGLRDNMKGWTTTVEAVLGIAISIFGELIGGIQDAQAAGYIPSQVVSYVPIVLFIWFLVKRLGTITPVGKSL
jgi:hypothetical protein